MSSFEMIDLEELTASLENDDYLGFCLNCGWQQDGCEPDARNYECDECGHSAVFGAQELALMGALE